MKKAQLILRFRKRRRAKAVYERWDQEEAVDAARRAVLASASANASEAAPAPDAPMSMRPSVPSVPKIEHGGGWHTLH